jgi:hypothetical protein
MNRSVLRGLVLSLGLVTGFGSISAQVGPEPPLYIGDVNGDGTVTAADAMLALRASIGLEDPLSPWRIASDVSPFPGMEGKSIGDGRTDLSDVRQILRFALGLIPEEEFRPIAPPPGRVSFQKDVLPIFRNSGCESPLCHGGPPPKADFYLIEGDEYDAIVNVASSEAPGALRIKPGDPDHSYLLAKLLGAQEALGGEGERMPAGEALIAPPLPDEEIAVIRNWILEGAPDN